MNRNGNALICRQNWLETRDYLRYCADVRQNSKGSLRLYRRVMDILLEWSRDVELCQASRLRPVFPAYLETQNLSASYKRKTCSVSRAYFKWARMRWPNRYSSVSQMYIESIHPAKGEGSVRERKLYTLDDVLALVNLPASTLSERRDQAAVAFLFLSGMRDGAFCSLPVRAVDLSKRTGLVMQWPSLGVHTKNSKAANTWLLAIPELQAVITSWHREILEQLGPYGLWYSKIKFNGLEFDDDQQPGEHRTFARRLRLMCERAKMEYLSPHKLRHGHAVYALKNASTVEDLKAISQNLMHESIATTDSIYSDLVDQDVASRIESLGTTRNGGEKAQAIQLAEQLFKALGVSVRDLNM